MTILNEAARVIGCEKMTEAAFLFQSKTEPGRLFVTVCNDYELAWFRATQAIGPNLSYFGRLTTLEMQARLMGGKMELRAMRAKS